MSRSTDTLDRPTRRGFIGSALAMAAAGCTTFPTTFSGARVMTVEGWLAASDMGMTLSHEHLFADVREIAEQERTPLTPDMADVERRVLPFAAALRKAGCRTLIDATATTLGRNPEVARRIARASGLNVIIPAGVYAAANGRFLPSYALTESEEQLAARFGREWNDGIGDTGIRPGFLKIGVNGGPLTELEAKIMSAAARSHSATGLAVAVHTSPWGESAPGTNARSNADQAAIFDRAGAPQDALIWVHAQNEAQGEAHILAARRGNYVSFDGYRPGQEADYVARVRRLAEAGLLERVLLSQDAGWYTLGEPNGGDFAPFDPILTTLLPALRAAGFSQAEIETLFISNPARAFAVRSPTVS